MAQRKSIAIVGATNKNGEEMANRLSQGEYDLLLISNNKEALDHLSEKMKAHQPKAEINFIECVKDGCWEADIIMLAVSSDEEKKVAEMMKEVATQKIVAELLDDENAGEELSRVLPYSKLVSVSGNFASGEIMICGDDEAANEEISAIFNQAGYSIDILNNSFANN